MARMRMTGIQMSRIKRSISSGMIVFVLLLLQACATDEVLFAEYDQNFCVVPEFPGQTLNWEPVVFFASDSNELTAEQAKKLDINIKTLAKLPGYKVSLKGFADHQASNQYNQNLSQRRVESVISALVGEMGLDASRVISSAHGETSPLTNVVVGPVAVDRRVEMLLLDPDLVAVANQPLMRAQPK